MPAAVDASMDLLKTIQRDALEPEYRQYGQMRRESRPPRSRAMGAIGLALAASLLTVAAVQTSRQAPAAVSERAHLVDQIRAAQAAQDASRRDIASINAEILAFQEAQQPPSGTAAARLAALSGQAPVVGPGLVVSVDDSHHEGSPQISDQDLRQLVNGLWGAGAEAISVNGHRVTARTAIRQAGSAITVDYSSLTHPYRVEAIGSPTSLAGDFAASPGGRRWAFLRSNYQIFYEVTTAERLSLPGDAALTTTTANPQR